MATSLFTPVAGNYILKQPRDPTNAVGTGKPECLFQARAGSRQSHPQHPLCDTHPPYHQMLLSIAPMDLSAVNRVSRVQSSHRGSRIEPLPAPQGRERRAGSQRLQQPQLVRYGSFQPCPGFPPPPFQSNVLASISCLSLKEKTLQAAANFQAVHISAEKRGCLLTARGSWDRDRRRAKPAVQRSTGASALASGDRSITLTRREETGPGHPRRWRSWHRTPRQGRSRPRSRHADSILVAGCRSRGDSSLHWEGLETKPSFSEGWEASAARPATLTGRSALPPSRPSGMWLGLGKPRAAEPPDPARGSACGAGEQPRESRGASRRAPLLFQGGHSSTAGTPTDEQKGAAQPTGSMLRGSDGISWGRNKDKKRPVPLQNRDFKSTC